MHEANIVVVGNEKAFRWNLKERLEHLGYDVSAVHDTGQALERCSQDVDLVLLDTDIDAADCLELLKKIKNIDPEILVVLLTEHPSVDVAVEAMKLGAFDYLPKPFVSHVTMVVRRALDTTQLRRQLRLARSDQENPYRLGQIIGTSSALTRAKSLLARVAQSPASTVLLLGESGTGKDLAAKALHFSSLRMNRRFMNITCSALPETLLETELFGHERGAFTDAKHQKKGLFEAADGGTVFLDEIGEMALPLQAKLLRFLEERSFKRVGGQDDITVDVRIIAATHRDLRQEVQRGNFREDLFYRLNVLPIVLPPLRDRIEDIPLLVNAFIDRFNHEFGKQIQGASPEAIRLLCSCAWPGNVRELRNLVERAMLLADDARMLIPSDFLIFSNPAAGDVAFKLPSHGVDIEEVERSLLVQALERTGWNQTAAARLLSLHRDQVRYRIKKFDLESEPKSVSPGEQTLEFPAFHALA